MVFKLDGVIMSGCSLLDVNNVSDYRSDYSTIADGVPQPGS